MGVQNTNQRVEQVKKFIKMPDRRLISGLLYVNVVNHNNNDSKDDFIQQLHDAETASAGSVSNAIKYSNSFAQSGTSPFSDAFKGFQNRGRDLMKHSFADYDCFLFFIAGGMTLSGGAVAPSGLTTASGGVALNNITPSVVSASGSDYVWDDTGATLTTADLNATWYVNRTNPYGDYCSQFIKYHLISRINNASGHGLNQFSNGRNVFYKSRPVHRQTYTCPAGDVNLADSPTVTNEYVLSHGKYATTDTKGTDLGASSYATIGTGNTNSNFKKISEDIVTAGETQNADGSIAAGTEGNTYYSPVDKIKIYGTHNFTPANHSDGVSTSVWSTGGTGAVHDTDFWSLVVDVGLRGNNPGVTTSDQVSNKALLRSQVNVSFQPFGETQTFNVADAIHTS